MTNLTILQLNDLHGYVEPHSELRRDAHGDFQFAQMGGLARIKTLFDQARQENPGGVIALDNGDTFHGTHFAVQDRARAMVPLINALGFDAMTLHWEFAYGPERVAEISSELAHPMLAANIFCEDSSELFMPPSTIIDTQRGAGRHCRPRLPDCGQDDAAIFQQGASLCHGQCRTARTY